MRRSNDEQTAEDEWEFRAERGLRVIAIKRNEPGLGQVVEAQLAVFRPATTLMLRIASYHHDLDGDGPAIAPPFVAIAEWANLPDNALTLLDMRMVNPVATMPMVLPYRDAIGKKPDVHYGQVLIFKRACARAGIAYAERIGNDNGVEPGVVYRWVQEAGRRGITIDDDDQVLVHGLKMNDTTLTGGAAQ